MHHDLRTRLASDEAVLLDGGLATSLESGGYALPGPLWSARALLDAPARIRAAHTAFVDAGAEVLLTASYQLSRSGLRASGEDPARLDRLLARSARLAREAAAEARRPVWVAGSLGPYGAALADGSEYTGRYGVGRATLRDFHGPRLEALASADVDVLALETIPSGEEVAVLAELLAAAGRPAWISVTLAGDGTRTPRGEPLDEALAPAAAADDVLAVGVNCCPPDLVVPALERLRSLGMPLLAKPNAGARWDPAHRRWGPPRSAADPRPWVLAGARLVGGCCGTSPADLAGLAASLGP
jgi:homocysteine S-methyltransferase